MERISTLIERSGMTSEDAREVGSTKKFYCWIAQMTHIEDIKKQQKNCELVTQDEPCAEDEQFDSIKKCNEFLDQFPLQQIKPKFGIRPGTLNHQFQ